MVERITYWLADAKVQYAADCAQGSGRCIHRNVPGAPWQPQLGIASAEGAADHWSGLSGRRGCGPFATPRWQDIGAFDAMGILQLLANWLGGCRRGGGVCALGALDGDLPQGVGASGGGWIRSTAWQAGVVRAGSGRPGAEIWDLDAEKRSGLAARRCAVPALARHGPWSWSPWVIPAGLRARGQGVLYSGALPLAPAQFAAGPPTAGKRARGVATGVGRRSHPLASAG